MFLCRPKVPVVRTSRNAAATPCWCHHNGAVSRLMAEVEVWQARPDGTYSSLRRTSGDCRARQQRNITTTTTATTSTITFDTVAPGSVGSLGGLTGDSSSGMYDLPPYGPPVLHILARATGHAPVLVDVPVSTAMADDDVASHSFWDLRGAAWVRGSEESPRYRITSAAWRRDHGGDDDDRVLEIHVEIRLPRYQEEDEGGVHSSIIRATTTTLSLFDLRTAIVLLFGTDCRLRSVDAQLF